MVIGIIDQAVSLFSPVAADGEDLLCRSHVVHQDGELLHSTAEISDANGNRVAIGHQTSRFLPMRRRSAAAEPERVLATVLFTDIVGSTEHAERLGDAKWREVLDAHHALVRRQIQTFKGREVKTTGDGFLLAFDSPARAVQCARAIRDGVARLGLEIRAGLHSGECEVVGSDLAGIAVHVASRVQTAAGPGEVLVSSTVRDLVAGSGLRFADRGRHELKGLEGDWHLLAIVD
jgi:class 3 adenylate cyclase